MIVLKFGGTSVQNAEMIDKTLDITISRIEKAPILVASAMSKVTDSLIKVMEAAVNGRSEEAEKIIDDLLQRHIAAAESFLSGKNLSEAKTRLTAMHRELSSLTKGLCLLKECSGRTGDTVLAFGELMSTVLIACRARERGYKTDFADSRTFLRTDDHFAAAMPDMKAIKKLARQKLKPAPGKIVVCQGFIGSTENGVTTTLGRGGSDFTATIIGSALGAAEVEIWTDVDGIMTTDPRLIPAAASIPEISYNEAAELAYFGAKVVHPSTIQPAVDQKIPVWVKNTKNSGHAGTVILPEVDGRGLRAIAAKKGITLINVVSSRMLNAYGFLNRIFCIFEKYRTPVDIIATSEVSVSMSVENAARLKDIVKDIEEFAEVDARKNRAIICLVGKNAWEQGDVFVRVFTALKDISVRMISFGASQINLSIVVPEEECDTAVKLLHREFFE
jgi:aspartate kinase